MAEEIHDGKGRDRETQKNLLRKVINILNVNRGVQRQDTKTQTETLHSDNEDIINAISDSNQHLMNLGTTFTGGRGDALEEKREQRQVFKGLLNLPNKIKEGVGSRVSSLKEKLTPKNPFKGIIGGIGNLLGGAAKAFIPLLAIGALIGTPLFDGQRFKDNVLALLSIGKEIGLIEFFTGLVFFKAMSMIAKGLLVFSVGAAGVGLTQGVLDKFGATGWANTIKENVLTLLSIGKEAGLMGIFTGAVFLPAMTMLAKGLAVFSLGAGVAAGINQALEYFGQANWATTIKDNVLTLLSIGGGNLTELATTLGQTGVFVAAMTGLAAGLGVFAVGAGLAQFSQSDFATKIKDNVTTLLSIASLPDIETKTEGFKNSMSNIAKGLASFGAGNFIGSLGKAGSAIVNFFTGKENSSSAFDEILKVADKSAEIDRSAVAINKLKKSLDGLSGISMPEISLGLSRKTLTEFANLSALITGLQKGGEVEYATGQGRQRSKIDFGKSILDPGLRFEEVKAKVQLASQILDGGNVGRSPAVTPSERLTEREANRQEGQAQSSMGAPINTNVVTGNGDTIVQGDTLIGSNSPATDSLDRTR